MGGADKELLPHQFELKLQILITEVGNNLASIILIYLVSNFIPVS